MYVRIHPGAAATLYKQRLFRTTLRSQQLLPSAVPKNRFRGHSIFLMFYSFPFFGDPHKLTLAAWFDVCDIGGLVWYRVRFIGS